MWKKHIFSIFVVLIITACLNANASSIVYDPFNHVVNAATALRMLKELSETAKEIENQITLIKNQVQNLKTFPDQQWDDAKEALAKLGNIMNQGQTIAYSMDNIDAAFKQRFPGYQDSNYDITNYPAAYKGWVTTNQDSMDNVLKTLHASSQQFGQEEAMNKILATRAKTATGRMQALQVGNEIAAEQIAQLQKLRQIVMAQTSAEAEYYAYKGQKDAAQEQSVDEVIKNADKRFPAYKNNSQFGLIPEFGKG